DDSSTCVSSSTNIYSYSVSRLLFIFTRVPPPRSPLFPYTTLFRSCGSDANPPASNMVFKSRGSVQCTGGGTPPVHCTEPRDLNRSEEHTSELQSRVDLVCRLLLEKKKKRKRTN